MHRIEEACGGYGGGSVFDPAADASARYRMLTEIMPVGDRTEKLVYRYDELSGLANYYFPVNDTLVEGHLSSAYSGETNVVCVTESESLAEAHIFHAQTICRVRNLGALLLLAPLMFCNH